MINRQENKNWAISIIKRYASRNFIDAEPISNLAVLEEVINTMNSSLSGLRGDGMIIETIVYGLSYLIMLSLEIILLVIVIKHFLLPRIYGFILDTMPLCLVTPSSGQSIILKKYAYGRVVDEPDQYLIEHLASIGLVHTGTHEEDLPDDMITLVPTARTTRRGMLFLRHHLI
ncbi:MAG: hypothetical protein PHW52_04385 [Candidatus Pacebacteria bacterium]|nr:hypothetical protein [Candidatus Paceibacterota bacterium]